MNLASLKPYLMPIVLFGISIVLFVVAIQPSIAKLGIVKESLASLQEKELRVNELLNQYESVRDVYQRISKQDKDTLEKALPSNINNVRLILDLEQMAEQRGLGFKDVDVILVEQQRAQENIGQEQLRKVQASMTLSGDYDSFIQFLSDVEQSLRILTMRKIDFNVQREDKKESKFEYKVVLETYWFVYPDAIPEDAGL